MQIRCEYTELKDIDGLKPNPKNPNKHSQQQVGILSKLFLYQGIRHPIIVSKQTGLIVAGHARLEAAKMLGLDKFPVDYQDFENEDQEYAFMISDNSIQELAVLDYSKINLEIPNLGPDFDIEALGIPDFTIEPMDNDLWNLNKKPIICPHCGKEI